LPIWTILLQLLIPVLLLLWLGLRPAPSRLGFGLQVLGTGLMLFALARVGLWALPPWWTPWILGGIWAVLVGRGLVLRARSLEESPPHLFPRRASGWAAAMVALALVLVGGAAVGAALTARSTPPVQVVDIPNPLGPGRYLVAHGGFRELVNGHMKTLDPGVPRFADWRGQSYAVDLMGINRMGLRTPGWRPEDPARYAIFGAPVHAPCAGTVLAAENTLPDMTVPVMDTAHMMGNHVLLQCGEVMLLLAHLREGSVEVAAGERVELGTLLGEVGNSGNTSEPHLHIHAQRAGTAAAPISGEPLVLRIDGRILVRNDRIQGTDWSAQPPTGGSDGDPARAPAASTGNQISTIPDPVSRSNPSP
jgi:hypothetical protein